MVTVTVAAHGMVPVSIYSIDLVTDVLTTNQYCFEDQEDIEFVVYCYVSIVLIMMPSIVLNSILIYLFWLESWSKRWWVRVLLVLGWILQLLPLFSLVRHVVKVVLGHSNASHIPGNAQMVRSTLTFLADIPQLSLQGYVMAKYLINFENDLVTPIKITSILVSLFSVALNMERFYCRVRKVDQSWAKAAVLTTIMAVTGSRLSVCALGAALISPSIWFVPVGLSFLLIMVVTYAKLRLSRSTELVLPARLIEDMFYSAVLQSVVSVGGVCSSAAFITAAALLYAYFSEVRQTLVVLLVTIVCHVLSSMVDFIFHHKGIYKRDSNVLSEANAENNDVQGEDNVAVVVEVVSTEHNDATPNTILTIPRTSLTTDVAPSSLERTSSLQSRNDSNILQTEINTTPS